MRTASHIARPGAGLRVVLSTLALVALTPNPASAFVHLCGSMGGVSAPDCGCEHDEPGANKSSEARSQVAAPRCCQVEQGQAGEGTIRDRAWNSHGEDPDRAGPPRVTYASPARSQAMSQNRGERDPPVRAPLFKRHCSFLN